MIEPSFRALLMPAIGQSPLPNPGLLAAGETAITLPMITVPAQEEKRAAFTGKTKPLPQNRFAVRRHTPSQAALDKGQAFVAG